MGTVSRLRIVKLAEGRFERTAELCDLRSGSAEERDLRRVIGELRWQRLPGPRDFEVPALPLADVIRWGRSVNSSLWIVYDYDDDESPGTLYLLSLHRRRHR